METKTVMMPRALTAENGAKGALMGEFSFDLPLTCSDCDVRGAQEDCEVCGGEINYKLTVNVPWTTIKEIYAVAVKHLGT